MKLAELTARWVSENNDRQALVHVMAEAGEPASGKYAYFVRDESDRPVGWSNYRFGSSGEALADAETLVSDFLSGDLA